MNGLKKIVSQLMIFDCTARELIFPDLEVSENPKIGDTAHDADGKPLDGLILLPEGDLYKFSNGKLIEILVDDSTVAKLAKLSKKTATEIKAKAQKDARELRAEVTKELNKIKTRIGWDL